MRKCLQIDPCLSLDACLSAAQVQLELRLVGCTGLQWLRCSCAHTVDRHTSKERHGSLWGYLLHTCFVRCFVRLNCLSKKSHETGMRKCFQIDPCLSLDVCLSAAHAARLSTRRGFQCSVAFNAASHSTRRDLQRGVAFNAAWLSTQRGLQQSVASMVCRYVGM